MGKGEIQMLIEGPEYSDSKRTSYSTEQHSNIMAKDALNHMGIEEIILKDDLHNDQHKDRFPSLLHQSLMMTSPCYYKCSNCINRIPNIRTYAGSTWETNSSSAASFEARSRSFSLLNNDINYVSDSSSEKMGLNGLDEQFSNSCSCDDTQSIIDESFNSIFFEDYDSVGSDTLIFSDEENNSDEADSRNDSEAERYTQYGDRSTEGDASALTDTGASTMSRRRKEWKVIYKKREQGLDNGLRAMVGHVIHSKQPKEQNTYIEKSRGDLASRVSTFSLKPLSFIPSPGHRDSDNPSQHSDHPPVSLSSSSSLTERDQYDRIQYADKNELTSFLLAVLNQYPDLIRLVFNNHRADWSLTLPLPQPDEHKFLKQCIYCQSKAKFDRRIGASICKHCSRRSTRYEQEDVMKKFNLSEKETNMFHDSLSKGRKKTYGVESICRYLAIKHNSVFRWYLINRASSKIQEKYVNPLTLDLYKIARSKVQKKQVIIEALMFTEEDDIRSLVTIATLHESRILNPGGFMDNFKPKRLPSIIPKGHPLLTKCFLCNSTDSLKKCKDLKVCKSCSSRTFNKKELMDLFCLSTVDAKILPSKTRTGKYFNDVVSEFSFRNATAGCMDKYGSMFNMTKRRIRS